MTQQQTINWDEIQNKLDDIRPVEGGFSLAKRGLITLNDGRHVFVKIGLQDNTKKWANKEINTYRFLQSQQYPHMPNLLSVNDDLTGFAISAYTPEDCWDWKENWDYDRLNKTLEAMDDLAAIKPVGKDIELFSEASLGPNDDGWSKLLVSPELQKRLHDKLKAISRTDIFDQIDFKREAERSLKFAFSNDALVHNDIRSDNGAWNPITKQIRLVDWNWTQIGDRRVDLAATLTHVCQHGLELIPNYSSRLDADALHWCAGFWLHAGATPIWEGGSDSLRVLQLTSGITALDLRNSLLSSK